MRTSQMQDKHHFQAAWIGVILSNVVSMPTKFFIWKEHEVYYLFPTNKWNGIWTILLGFPTDCGDSTRPPAARADAEGRVQAPGGRKAAARRPRRRQPRAVGWAVQVCPVMSNFLPSVLLFFVQLVSYSFLFLLLQIREGKQRNHFSGESKIFFEGKKQRN